MVCRCENVVVFDGSLPSRLAKTIDRTRLLPKIPAPYVCISFGKACADRARRSKKDELYHVREVRALEKELERHKGEQRTSFLLARMEAVRERYEVGSFYATWMTTAHLRIFGKLAGTLKKWYEEYMTIRRREIRQTQYDE